eukprot:TRINITY_DN15641_c0_g1_i3.p1 TRINITY_DN15641_c0_g1~~TRINITY_DN15641_c0_g1_i3.p1  ORF type:complete len:118 (-),score=1.41 TRINITY_DN15641_c0_g1_i3:143-496(-)
MVRLLANNIYAQTRKVNRTGTCTIKHWQKKCGKVVAAVSLTKESLLQAASKHWLLRAQQLPEKEQKAHINLTRLYSVDFRAKLVASKRGRVEGCNGLTPHGQKRSRHHAVTPHLLLP